MRCPKCGYISFDHVETCLKCNKDISGKVEVEGTTYHAASPSFLKIPRRTRQEEVYENDREDMLAENDDYEYSDPDLDVLADEEQGFDFDDEEGATISFDDSDLEGGGESEDFQLDPDEMDEDLDFNFDDDASSDESAPIAELNVPDELSDISDLAPPATDEMSLSLDDEPSMDDDFDLDGLDLNLGLGGDAGEDEGELSLSLDDIDISVDEGFGDSELDGLNMDLDLGDIDTGESQKKESQSSSGLEGISLSLD